MPRHVEASSEEVITVEIGTLGGVIEKYMLPSGSTVSDALEKASLPSDSEVRCAGEVYGGSDILEDGDILTVIAGERVKGGN